MILISSCGLRTALKQAACLDGNSKYDRYQISSLELVGFPMPSHQCFLLCRLRVGIVYRHAGAHGIFVDLGFFGSTGCWQNNCGSSPQPKPKLDGQNAVCLPGTRGIQTNSTVRTSGGILKSLCPVALIPHVVSARKGMEIRLQEGCHKDSSNPPRGGPRHLRASLLAG